MKTIVTAAAAATLLSLAACGHRSPEADAVQNNADAMEASLENQADNMEAMADNTADHDAAQAMENAADNLEDAKGNVAHAADARIDNLR